MTNWNNRRYALIAKEVDETITPDEKTELEHLQAKADEVADDTLQPRIEALEKVLAQNNALQSQLAHVMNTVGATIDGNGDLTFDSKGYCAWAKRKGGERTQEILAKNADLLARVAELEKENETLKYTHTPRRQITLCGSTKFKKAWMEWNARLTLEGCVVYSVAMWSHGIRIEPTDEQKELLDVVHKAKIDASDEIFVLDIGGYIGSSTRSEIDHAIKTNKAVRYLSKEYPDWTEDDCEFAQDDTALTLATERAEKSEKQLELKHAKLILQIDACDECHRNRIDESDRHQQEVRGITQRAEAAEKVVVLADKLMDVMNEFDDDPQVWGESMQYLQTAIDAIGKERLLEMKFGKPEKQL